MSAIIHLRADRRRTLKQRLPSIALAGIVCLVLCLPTASCADAQTDVVERLKFGIAPYSASSRLVPSWAPLVRYLEAELGQPIATVSAPSHQQFIRRAKSGEYFFYVSTPHSAVAAITNGEALPVRYLSVPFRGQLVVPAESTVSRLSDLSDSVIVTSSPDSFVAASLDYEINRLQYLSPFSVTVRYEKTHTAALRSLLNGLADAAYIARLPHRQPGPMAVQIKMVQQSALVGYPFMLVPADAGEKRAARLGKILDKFEAESPQADITLTPVTGESRYRFAPIQKEQLQRLSELAEHWQAQTPVGQPF